MNDDTPISDLIPHAAHIGGRPSSIDAVRAYASQIGAKITEYHNVLATGGCVSWQFSPQVNPDTINAVCEILTQRGYTLARRSNIRGVEVAIYIHETLEGESE